MVSLSVNITMQPLSLPYPGRNADYVSFCKGVQVKSVSLRHAQPVIRIARHAWCDEIKKQGRARFDHTGNDRFGRFRQGVYLDESGCRVVWSESIH
jgi:hypothetical protein